MIDNKMIITPTEKKSETKFIFLFGYYYNQRIFYTIYHLVIDIISAYFIQYTILFGI